MRFRPTIAWLFFFGGAALGLLLDTALGRPGLLLDTALGRLGLLLGTALGPLGSAFTLGYLLWACYWGVPPVMRWWGKGVGLWSADQGCVYLGLFPLVLCAGIVYSVAGGALIHSLAASLRD